MRNSYYKKKVLTHFKSQSMTTDSLSSSISKTQQQWQKFLNKQQHNIDDKPPVSIYFDRNKKNTYIITTIDEYFWNKGKSLINEKTLFKKQNVNQQNDSNQSLSIQRIKVGKSSKNQTSKISLSALNCWKPRNGLKNIFMKQKNSSLPIIEESNQGIKKRPYSEQKQRNLYCDDKLNNSTYVTRTQMRADSQKNIISNNKTRKVFENNHYTTYQIIDSKKKITQQRQYKNIDDALLIRQKKVSKIKIPQLWHESIQQLVLIFPKIKSLRQTYYTLVQEYSGKQKIYLIKTKLAYKQLWVDNNSQLIDLIICLCKQLIRMQNQVINNKIHINNIYRVQQKQYVIGDWGSAGIKQEIWSGDNMIEMKLNPITSDSTGWLVIPEYLSPQILYCISIDNFKELSFNNSCDIWSLGCLIFQIITLVPLWMPFRSGINNFQLQRGLLSNKIRTIPQIMHKQRNFRNIVERTIRKSFKNAPIRPDIVLLMLQMLHEDPNKRITPQSIISHLTTE